VSKTISNVFAGTLTIPTNKRWPWICLLCLCSLVAIAQQDSQAPSPAPRSTAPAPAGDASRQVLLDVVVTDQSGQAVSGLQRQNFTLLDDKQPQPLTSFHAAQNPTATPDPPVEVVLVIDEVNTTYHDVAIVRQQAEKFLSQNDGKLAWPVSLVFFSASGATGGAPSRDGKALIAELNQRQTVLRGPTRAQGLSGSVERINLSVRTLGQIIDYQVPRPGRKLVVWLSPGWGFLDTPRVELSSKDQQGLFQSIVGISAGMRLARITLYNVNPTGSGGGVLKSYYKDFIKGVKSANQVRIGNVALQVFAYQSGGLILNSSNDLAGEIAKCVDDANTFYTLSFEGAIGDGPNEYHALAVSVDRPGLDVRTRSGYYAQPGQAHAR
jgi:VWFA-related protein